MNRHGIFLTSACALCAVIAGLAALSAGAFAAGSKAPEGIANGLRSGSNLPKIETRHAVSKKQQRKRKARRHRARHTKPRGVAETGVSIPGTGGDTGDSSGVGNSAPAGGNGTGTGTGTGTGGKKTAPTSPTSPTSPTAPTSPTKPTKPTTPVTETPATPPVTETPPVTTPPAETPSTPTTPNQTTHCFSSPHLCGFPDPTNTGVPAGTSLTASGSINVTQAGTVISGRQVTGTINVLANNVTIENTKVTQNTTCGTRSTCGNYAIRIEGGVSGTTIRHVETASAPGDTCEHDIRNTGGTTTIEYAYLHACDSNVYAVGPTTLKNSYGIGALAISEDHVENIYFNETSFTAIHDTLLNPVEQTAVIFGNSGGGYDVTNCSNQLTVLESLLGGGGYSLYPCAHAAQAGTSSLKVEGNHFARCVSAEGYEPNGGTHPCVGGADSSGYYPKSGSYGVATNYFTAVTTWRNNVWDNNLAKVCISGSSSGCE
ncbi:MAG TPA: hypothetical protein VMF55_13395 [Solirubrobacterales bacterium]|nr:hypothetical protein [Solirubrobacterales bacterium]